MSGLEITLLIIISYVGIGFGVASGCDDEDHPIGKGCVWPLYLIVEATKATYDRFKRPKDANGKPIVTTEEETSYWERFAIMAAVVIVVVLSIAYILGR